MRELFLKHKNKLIVFSLITILFSSQYLLHENNKPLDLSNPADMKVGRLEKLADRNNLQALLILGNMYQSGVYGVKEDKAKAFAYYKKSAQLGSSEGAYNAALLSNTKNKETLEFLWQAYRGGVIEAQVSLGNYLVRLGEKDSGEVLLTEAAQRLNSQAMVQLGNIHKEGLLKNSSMTESLYWFLLSQKFERDNLQKMILDDKIQALGKDMDIKDLTEAEIRSSAWYLGSTQR